MPRHFKKELLSNPIRFNGSSIRFEPVGRDVGVRAFEEGGDNAVIAELDKLADARKMGVVRISDEIYQTLKKKSVLLPSKPQSGVLSQPIRAFKPKESLVAPKKLVALPAATSKPTEQKSAPVPNTGSVPSKLFVPKRARVSTVEPKADEPPKV